MLTKTPRNGKSGKNGKKSPLVTELPKINNTTDTRDILAHKDTDRVDGGAASNGDGAEAS